MYAVVKRGMDFLISLIFMPFILLVIGVSAVFIKIEDGGSVFYMAARTGRNGKPFRMFKLRSMKVNAPDIRLADGSTFNSEDDPRVTRFGKFARKTSIDELPQLINVLKGDMALIGPRPDSVSYIDQYTDEERKMLRVRPGITGYNQAMNRNAVGTKEKLRNDVFYVEHLTFALDVKILFMTIRSVLSHKDVYRVEEGQQTETYTENAETADSRENAEVHS